MKFRVIAVLAFAMITGLSMTRPLQAQTPSVKIGLPSLSMFSVMNALAKDLGYFDREGVQVDISHFESGSLNIKALLARSVDVADVETGLILGAVANGADLRIIGTHSQGLHFALYARKDITNLKGAYGHTFAISGVGGLPHLVLLALLERQQLDVDRIQLLTVGGTSARLSALMAGKVDSTLGEYSPKVEADPAIHRLMIVSKELPLYMAQGLAVWGDTLETKKDALKRWQRGLIKATRWAYEHKAEFITAAAKHLPTSSEELGKIYDFYLDARVWAINGELDPKRVAYMQDLGLRTKTQSKPVDLGKLVWMDNVKDLEAELGRREYPSRP
jgi:NitT/TauT family transport system substrate-binding protein